MIAEEKKVRPINRLATVKDVRPIVDKMYQEGIEATSGGKPVASATVELYLGCNLCDSSAKPRFSLVRAECARILCDRYRPASKGYQTC